MGDTSIAAALRTGVDASINLFGERLKIVRKTVSARDPDNPSKFLDAGEVTFARDGIIADVEDRSIDGNVILLGDKEVVFEATVADADDGEFVPKIGDTVTDSADRVFVIVRINTNRVAGVDVSYEVILR